MLGINLKKYEVLEPFEELPDRAKKFIFRLLIKDVLKAIERIQPRIHRIVLSGEYLYRNIENKLGSLKIDGGYEPYIEHPYRKRAFKNYQGTRFKFYFDPFAGYFPNCMVEFIYKKHIPMFELGYFFPDLKVSSIEYTLDFFCKDINRPQNVRNLFLLFKQYLYSKNKKKTIFYDNRENFTYYIGTDKNFKIYERGKDNLRIKDELDYFIQGWKFENLDRLRLEYTLADDAIKKNNLKNFIDFSKDCKFSLVMADLFEFRRFNDEIEELPKEWNNYHRKGSSYNGFQDEYLMQRKLGNVKSLKRQTTVVPSFIMLNLKIKNLIKSFNERWKTRSQLLLNSK